MYEIDQLLFLEYEFPQLNFNNSSPRKSGKSTPNGPKKIHKNSSVSSAQQAHLNQDLGARK